MCVWVGGPYWYIVLAAMELIIDGDLRKELNQRDLEVSQLDIHRTDQRAKPKVTRTEDR